MRILFALVFLSTVAHAAGFDELKALAGRWQVVEFGNTSQASIELMAGGTAVLQKSGFTAVYYPNNAEIGLMLFPDEGNAQRFRCQPQRDAIDCQLVEVANARPGLGSFKSVTLSFPAKNRMSQRWVWREPDGKTRTFDIDFRRR